MDGFDDLLAPSRNALEENPFEDPFAKRSGSPDPWTSGWSRTEQHYSEPDHHLTFQEQAVTTPTESFVSAKESSHSTDPLDSADHTAHDDFYDDDDDRPLGRSRTSPITSPQSPGFRESTAVPFSETATIRPTVPEEFEPSTPAKSYYPIADAGPSLSIVSQPVKRVDSSSSRIAFISHSPSTSKAGSVVVSPLETPSSGLDRSFAGLALGGESIGGWQAEQRSWTSDQPAARAPSRDSDDEPIRKPPQTEADDAAHAPADSISPLQRKDKGIAPVFIISVDDPQKVGDPIRSFTMYTVHTRTTSPLFSRSSFSVLRRYSDFLWLYETLSMNNPGVVVPPTPEKSSFGRFDDTFVQQRRLGLEKCIQKIANHPVLCKDSDLKFFLESDNFALDIKQRKAEIANERGGLMASIGQTITGPRFYEIDEWFDRQKAYLDSLESQLRGLAKAIELVAKHRSELAAATGEFAQTVSDLSSSDVGKQLSHSLAALADVERKAQELQSMQSQQDMVTLMSTVDEYARLINSVRVAFNSRIRTYHAWQNADAQVRRVKQVHENARAQGRQQLGHTLSLIGDAERRALEAKHEFDHCSKLIKTEVARFERERVEDFKDTLHAFLEGMILRQKQLISGWESYQELLLKKVGGGEQQAIPSQSPPHSP